MKDARIISKHRPGSTMLELREGRDGTGRIIYKAGVASDSEDVRLKLIERLMEVAREWGIERLFLAPVVSAGDNLVDGVEYRLCPICGKYWPVEQPGVRMGKIGDARHPPSKGAEQGQNDLASWV